MKKERGDEGGGEERDTKTRDRTKNLEVDKEDDRYVNIETNIKSAAIQGSRVTPSHSTSETERSLIS